MPCRRRKPTYKTKKAAKRHGAITYGKGNTRVYRVKGGWHVIRR